MFGCDSIFFVPRCLAMDPAHASASANVVAGAGLLVTAVASAAASKLFDRSISEAASCHRPVP